ncbi:hypothetical protein CEXT_22651 [Caerostris extrusa]|uniref:Uncharacterized protein n=1 Tax=Caerostris extrusa TaxID=172846 RepID=A0AAV4MHY8_CAEEX|nr:hypothetical protein CEXT_22651 [Caerostris extrusa]
MALAGLIRFTPKDPLKLFHNLEKYTERHIVIIKFYSWSLGSNTIVRRAIGDKGNLIKADAIAAAAPSGDNFSHLVPSAVSTVLISPLLNRSLRFAFAFAGIGGIRNK